MPLDSEQVTQAVRALYTYIAHKSSSTPTAPTPLFTDDPFIYLQLSLKRTPTYPTTSPIRIPLPHPLYLAPPTECCLITKDPKSSPLPNTPTNRALPLDSPLSLREYFQSHPLAPLTRILPLSRLRREYRQYKDRRDLLALYDVFLADDRILPLLPSVLGVKFFEKKKQPLPVNLRVKDKRGEVEAALKGTAMFIPKGSSLQVKIGRMSMARGEVCENVLGCVEEVVNNIPGKWGNVQMMGVRALDSITIPIYSSLPLQGIKAGREQQGKAMTEEEEEEGEDGEEEGEGEEEEKVAPAVPLFLTKASQKRRRGEVEESKTPTPPKKPRPTPTRPITGPSTSSPLTSSSNTKQSKGPPKAAKAFTSSPSQGGGDEDEEEEITFSADLPVEPLPSPAKKQRAEKRGVGTPGKKVQQVGATPQKKAVAVPLPASPAVEKEKRVGEKKSAGRLSLPVQKREVRAAGVGKVAPGSARKASRG